MTNIKRLKEANYGGAVSTIQYVDLNDVDQTQWPDREVMNIDGQIVLKPGKFWKKIEFTQLMFDENRVAAGGGYKYIQELFGIISKDRPEVSAVFESNQKRAFLVIYEDNNGFQKLIGNPKEPARFDIPKLEHRKFLERNGYEVIISCDSKDRAPFYHAELTELPDDRTAINTEGTKIGEGPGGEPIPCWDVVHVDSTGVNVLWPSGKPFIATPQFTTIKMNLVFPIDSENEQTVYVTSDEVGNYAWPPVNTNISAYQLKKNGVLITGAFSLVAGDELYAVITRNNLTLLSRIRITGTY
jgi:hypothetical protein